MVSLIGFFYPPYFRFLEAEICMGAGKKHQIFFQKHPIKNKINKNPFRNKKVLTYQSMSEQGDLFFITKKL